MVCFFLQASEQYNEIVELSVFLYVIIMVRVKNKNNIYNKRILKIPIYFISVTKTKLYFIPRDPYTVRNSIFQKIYANHKHFFCLN